MKSLLINSSNCLLSKSNYGVTINNIRIDDMVLKNLPEGLKDYRDYPVEFILQVKFFGQEELDISTEGYQIQSQESKESEDKE